LFSLTPVDFSLLFSFPFWSSPFLELFEIFFSPIRQQAAVPVLARLSDSFRAFLCLRLFRYGMALYQLLLSLVILCILFHRFGMAGRYGRVPPYQLLLSFVILCIFSLAFFKKRAKKYVGKTWYGHEVRELPARTYCRYRS
jgi:fatty acid desaturase